MPQVVSSETEQMEHLSLPPQVKCYGPGLEPIGCIVNKPADFTIDTRGAGRGELNLYGQVRTLLP